MIEILSISDTDCRDVGELNWIRCVSYNSGNIGNILGTWSLRDGCQREHTSAPTFCTWRPNLWLDLCTNGLYKCSQHSNIHGNVMESHCPHNHLFWTPSLRNHVVLDWWTHHALTTSQRQIPMFSETTEENEQVYQSRGRRLRQLYLLRRTNSPDRTQQNGGNMRREKLRRPLAMIW